MVAQFKNSLKFFSSCNKLEAPSKSCITVECTDNNVPIKSSRLTLIKK